MHHRKSLTISTVAPNTATTTTTNTTNPTNNNNNNNHKSHNTTSMAKQQPQQQQQQQHDDFSDDEFDFDEEYFSRTYRPLSNLPTPPLSSRESSASQSPRIPLEDGELVQSELLGPAVHLVNMVPPSASLLTPSVTIVHEILTRANLTMDTIALAVCILDSLDSKFSISWRLLCPLARPEATGHNHGHGHGGHSHGHAKRHTLPVNTIGGDGGGSGAAQQLHIDCVQPEVIVLAALMIAVKFVEDCQEPTQYYRTAWARGQWWTCEQINTTERCLMESLGYRILPLWDAGLIADAVDDMARAGKQALLPPGARRGGNSRSNNNNNNSGSPGSGGSNDDQHKRSKSTMSSGKAVLGLGLQLTPTDTPKTETIPSPYGSSGGGSLVPDDVRAAFLGTAAAAAYLSRESLQLPAQVGKKKAFRVGSP